MTSIEIKEEIRLIIIIIIYLEIRLEVLVISSQDIYLVRCNTQEEKIFMKLIYCDIQNITGEFFTQCHFENYLTCKCKG